MYPAIRYRLAHARLADLYCQILRDTAMHPAIRYDVARARIADVHYEAQRNALAITASQGRRRFAQ
jgi:hypothetical protein